MDRRFLASNGRVAHAPLEGRVEADRFVEGKPMRCAVPVTDLLAAPDGARDKQMLMGQPFKVLEIETGWAFGFDMVDGYVGYLPETALADLPAPTHRVISRATHAYTAADVKSPEQMLLSYFSEISVTGETSHFYETPHGYMPKAHMRPLTWVAEDMVSEAEKLLGTPYLWGGNGHDGIDCSGLVQLAAYAVGRSCPRDSDMQERMWPDAAGPYQRGDLLFWKGHVAIVTDQTTLLHANAHHMAVAYEGITEAITRIASQGEGPVTAHKRF